MSRGSVELPHGGWKELRVAVDGPGVLRLVPERTFLPLSRTDRAPARGRDRPPGRRPVTEIRFHSRDPRRRPRAWKLDERAGRVAAALLVLAGTLVAIGLFGAPDLVTYVVRSAERLALRITATRGLLAFDSVRLRFERLERRVAADELFLARVAAVISLPLPDGFPEDLLALEEATATDLELEVHRLARRLRAMETIRRRIASDGTPDPARIPSRSPIEPSSVVPLSVFGPRISPLTHRPEFHAGLALAAVDGTPVVAPAGGRVVFTGTRARAARAPPGGRSGSSSSSRTTSGRGRSSATSEASA